MDAVLRSEITKTLDMKKLQDIMPSYVRVARYDQLAKVKTIRDAMRGGSVLVLLFNIHDKKKRVLNQPGHYFLISLRGPEKCVVFSSTGMTPSKEVFITHSDPGLLQRILPKGTVFNDVKFQVNRSSNTCWRWMVLYAHLSKMGLQKFQKMFGNPRLVLHDSDTLVTAMTYILLA